MNIDHMRVRLAGVRGYLCFFFFPTTLMQVGAIAVRDWRIYCPDWDTLSADQGSGCCCILLRERHQMLHVVVGRCVSHNSVKARLEVRIVHVGGPNPPLCLSSLTCHGSIDFPSERLPARIGATRKNPARVKDFYVRIGGNVRWGGEIKMNVTKSLALLVFSMGTLSALSQTTPPADANTGRPTTDDDIAVLRQDVQADKTEIITRNMSFTDDQSKAFWPIYRDYAHEQQTIGDQRVALIKDYATNYDKIDDTQAKSYVQRALKFEEDSLKLREDYMPKFEKAIGARQAAKFYQVDSRLSLLVNLQLAAALPIIK
jgi:hypothetical protein